MALAQAPPGTYYTILYYTILYYTILVLGQEDEGGGEEHTIGAHGSFLIRRQRGHPGVVLPLVISDLANHQEGMQLELDPIRNEPNWKRAQLETNPIGNDPCVRDDRMYT